MVDKKTINEIINKAIIVKCSDGWNLSTKVRSTFNQFAKDTRSLTHEELIMCDKQGNVVFSKKGDNHSVGISDEEDNMLWSNYRDLDVDHNHPTVIGKDVTTCLSWEDMENPITVGTGKKIGEHEYEDVYLCKSVTAEAPNGSRMSLVRNYNFNLLSDGDNYENARGELVKANSQYKNKFTDAVLDYCINHVIEFKEKHPDAHVRESDFRDEAEDYVIKELGKFEETSDFKRVQKLFKDANCNLTVEWTT